MDKAWRGVKSLQGTKLNKVAGQVGENFQTIPFSCKKQQSPLEILLPFSLAHFCRNSWDTSLLTSRVIKWQDTSLGNLWTFRPALGMSQLLCPTLMRPEQVTAQGLVKAQNRPFTSLYKLVPKKETFSRWIYQVQNMSHWFRHWSWANQSQQIIYSHGKHPVNKYLVSGSLCRHHNMCKHLFIRQK